MVGRTAERGDELGSRLLSARLDGDVMSLAFTLSRQWQPYPKWRGTAFLALPAAADLAAPLAAATGAPRWRDRGSALAAACEILLKIQRASGFPAPASAVIQFWDRPCRTVGEAVCQSLRSVITDPDLARLPAVGSIEQWVSNVDVLSSPACRAALRTTCQAWLGSS